ncbi:MAG: hypothetical protein ACOC14_05480 [Bacillota bacterium]
MLETNKEYQSITALEKTINEAEKTRAKLATLNARKAKLENVSMTPEHKYFAYGKTLRQLENDGYKKTFLKILLHAVYLLVPYGLLFAAPIIGIYVLDRYNILDRDLFWTDSAYQFILAGIYAVLLVITVLTIFKVSRKIWKGQTKRRLNRLRASRHTLLTETLEESEKEIAHFNGIIESRIESLDQDIEALDKKLQEYHQKIEDNTMVPKKFIPDINAIRAYFEEGRVENIKDAINLLVHERREDQKFAALEKNLEQQINELKALKDVMMSIETLEQKISEKPITAEPEYKSDEERLLDAKLKAARTKKERKKLEKKKKKLEKKENKGS